MSALEDELIRLLKFGPAPEPVREFRFHPPRRFRFDLSWPDKLVAVEVEGGTYIHGRHQRPAGYAADCEKYNIAALDGWMVLRFTADMIHSGQAREQIEQALGVE